MDQDPAIAQLRAEVAQLREEARAARDWTEIANLQAMYGYYVDKGLWDKAADLFAGEGTLEIAGRGVYVGRERVRAYLHALPPYERGALFNHMQLQPVIHVEGDMAKARWRTFIQIAWLGGVARWGEATYENRYVREDGAWHIASLHGFITFYCEYDKGLNEGGIPLLRKIDGLEPDLPPTVEYEAFPEVFVPPFHYGDALVEKGA
ncbi:nuclear transport factor 2 family protein [Novosphingobium sp. BW1]|uniref:nuclear transport factor 2 family protein n=1 Tax=Novosphingobium sp. BW1 TaxID=2592621 RepID=UPI0011DED713|nr:nuclear transport factor 2 family protein [Novosphingobium sp. BW1]TYC84966.1 nuclear transport factor 2 family protein [Novosphingobium sp. BW1]